MNAHLELIFQDNAHPGDLELIRPPTANEPGRARLLAAHVSEAHTGQRVSSANGGALIGIILYERPEPPYNDVYWLELGTAST